jgi:hypothetical protein
VSSPSLNMPVIRLLVLKDWQLFERQLAAYVAGGIVSLCFLGMASPWSFYVGSLMLIIIMVAVACFAVSTSLLNERKEQDPGLRDEPAGLAARFLPGQADRQHHHLRRALRCPRRRARSR